MLPARFIPRTLVLWTAHVVMNALPCGIIARSFSASHMGEATAAMVLVTAAFVLLEPLTPLRQLLAGAGPWARSLRISLWIRSVMSLLLTLLLLSGDKTELMFLLGFVNLFMAGLAGAGLAEAERLTGQTLLHDGFPNAAAITLFTGLGLLGVVGMLALLVRMVLWVLARAKARDLEG